MAEQITTAEQATDALIVNAVCELQRHGNTHADNMRDMVDRRRAAAGERAGGAVLTAALVKSIRERVAAGEQQITIVRELGVGSATVSNIITRKSWRYVA